jgi:3'-5' exonuclease
LITHRQIFSRGRKAARDLSRPQDHQNKETLMPRPVVVFDIETIPDYAAIARANRLPEDDIEGAKKILGEEFPQAPFHEIVCISALTATYDISERVWRVIEMAALHTADRTEADLVSEFVQLIRCTSPTLVSYNGRAFDLPVIRFRAQLHRLAAPYLAAFPYFSYSEMHLDLCERLALKPRDRLTLDACCRVQRVGAKMAGMDGSRVAEFIAQQRHDEVALYCASDVAATYALFLLQERFAGRLSAEGAMRSHDSLQEALNRVERERPPRFVQAGLL